MVLLQKLKVAFLGTNGIPANYGGCETLYENLVRELSEKFDITVYCSNRPERMETKEYLGAKLKYYPMSANGWQSIPYDIITILDAVRYSDVLFYFGPAAGFMLPILRFFGFKKNIIVNHGGLNEWEREKFCFLQKRYVKWVHKCAAKNATTNIADNNLYVDSIRKAFNEESVVIRYGGDNAFRVEPTVELIAKYPFLKEKYYVSVSRAQVDNNLHILLEAFAKMQDYKLVLVSNFNSSQYGLDLLNKYKGYENILLIPGIYDQTELNAVRGNAFAYIHSHSRCGTSPSLCEAMYLERPIISFNAPVNHEVTQEQAFFFNDVNELMYIIKNTTISDYKYKASQTYKLANEEYTWTKVGEQYASLFRK